MGRSGATARSSRSSSRSSGAPGGISSRSSGAGNGTSCATRDTDGVLVHKMDTTLDGEFQKYAVESGAHPRALLRPDPRLQQLVAHLSDDDLRKLRRGGHDYRKLHAAYATAVELTRAPTVILAKTVKGWTLPVDLRGSQRHPPDEEALGGGDEGLPRPARAAHPDKDLDAGEPPTTTRAWTRRRSSTCWLAATPWAGSSPSGGSRRDPSTCRPEIYGQFAEHKQAVSTTMAFAGGCSAT